MTQRSELPIKPTEPIAFVAPFVLPYEGVSPNFSGPVPFCGAGASILGKVQIGAHAIIGPQSVIRADGHFIRIGDDFRSGESATIHIAHEIYPAIVGDRVTLGRNAVIHACTVGDDCVIEDDVVILDGSVLEANVVVEAGSTVFPRSTLKSGFVYAGSPAKPVGQVTSAERADRRAALREAIAASFQSSMSWAERPGGTSLREDVFVARTSHLCGRVEMHARSSVFFACHLDAGQASIVVGENSNIQDNSHIHVSRDGVTIGRDTTIGHNVRMQDCRIGEHSLIGIGSVLGVGTTIEDDVLVAAGSTTLAGQRLERGWLWGGRPARPIGKLNDAKRRMLHLTIEQYCIYADAYRRAQIHVA